ncbi:TOBE domain-containing protein [Rhizobacter sp. LjRoot28]
MEDDGGGSSLCRRLYNGAITPVRGPGRMTGRRRSAPAIGLEGTLSLRRGGHVLGSADRIALLEAIRHTGSMVQAAREVGISYKTAWDRVQDMNNVSGEPLVARSAGGAGGGGTQLTPAGLALIDAFRHLQTEHTAMLARLSHTLVDPEGALRLLSTLALKTSARNQLAGVVSRITRGAANADVVLALPGGVDEIVARITNASVDDLALAEGSHAVALVKASAVVVQSTVERSAAPTDPVDNQWPVAIERLLVEAGSAELQGRLRGGQSMVATLDPAEVARLRLAEGAAARFGFSASSVILGVA